VELHQLRVEGILVVKLIGRLDSSTSSQLERVVDENIDEGIQHIVLDMSELAYTSSAGLRAVLIVGKTLKPLQGRLVLAGMREAVREIFEISGFLALFEFVVSVDDGLAKISGG